jgi:hypothetical protein
MYVTELLRYLFADSRHKKTRTNTEKIIGINTGFVESACSRGRNKRLIA